MAGYPYKDLFMAGDLNQLAHPSYPIPLQRGPCNMALEIRHSCVTL